MKFFYRTRGTISVFLCLILLPVMIFGCMTVDASRIYLSKVVISDAGEMAMNAGLAQYNDILRDEYGLLAMDRSPEEMSDELAEYFNASLNGTGLPDAESYQKILDLLTENFKAINVEGSEIYKTDVEKQQIIEYMKYRAPVCLTELVLEKFDQLKDTNLMTEAMEAELDFSEAMEDCQDAFQEALEALNTLNQAIESFPSDDTIRKELENTEKDYKNVVSWALLMRESCLQYEEYSKSAQETDMQELAQKFVDSAKKVDLSNPLTEATFNAYIDCKFYMNTIDDHLGGIDELLKSSEDAEDEDNPQNGGAADANQEELEKLVKEYNEQKTEIGEYPQIMFSYAEMAVNSHHNSLNSYRDTADTAQKAAKTAYEKLEDVKDKLEKAEEKFYTWDDATNALKGVGKEGNMAEEVEEYRDFFSTGSGSSDLKNLEDLMASVASNRGFFEDYLDVLENEKFHKKRIAKDSVNDQLDKYEKEAESAVKRIAADYPSLETVWEKYIKEYEHVDISSSHSKQSINSDVFYNKLKRYCAEENGQNSQKDQDAANANLDKSQEAAAEADVIDDFLTYNWSESGVELPSVELKAMAENASDKLTGLSGESDVSNSSSRRDAISKFRESISEANNFLESVDRLLADNIENLYVAEYAMQMFSYYTVNMENGKSRPEQDIISLSGYDLTDHPAYRAECEYILWGNPSSQTNVSNTFMLLFGIRLLFNSFYAFTSPDIEFMASSASISIAGAAPYLIPIIKAAIKLGYAGVETANDISKLKQGYGVTIIKDAGTWATPTWTNVNGDNTKGVTLDYSEYLRVFLNVSLLSGHEADILGRIADCIQVNLNNKNAGIDLLDSYTMLAVEAKVSTRTTFMRKISDLGEGGSWGFPDDTYSISYQSILGY